MTEIEISVLAGIEPFHIYLCDQLKSTCIYIDTIFNSDIPYTFAIPPIFDGQDTFFIKAVDNNQCLLYFEILR